MISAARRGFDAQARARKSAKSGSLTVAMIQALIQGQAAMDGKWCEIWRGTDAVLNDKSLKQDLRPAAVDVIVEYMSLYQGDCK